jgi:hypothetical protein
VFIYFTRVLFKVTVNNCDGTASNNGMIVIDSWNDVEGSGRGLV